MKAFRTITRILGTALLTALSLGMVSCEKEEPVTPAPVLRLAQDQVPSGKGSQFLSVNATGAWTLTPSAEWVHFNPSSGTGDNSAISLSWDANTGDKARSVVITLSCGGKSASATLRQNAKSDDPVPEGPSGGFTKRPWMELPATQDGDGLYFYTHDMNVAGKTVRNYSFYWDNLHRVARWVAYPLNRGLIGSGKRTDLWGKDPLLSSSSQPTVTSTFRGGWTRGHQIPSADRLNREANIATFYGTNMTPQDYDFNGEIWARLESTVRSWSNKCDTLYVVTGCVVEGSTEKAYDVDNKAITVPLAYYKAVLSYNKSSSTMGGYRGCAVYLEHTHRPSDTVSKGHDAIMSVRDLENKLGIDLFVNLPAAVGKETAEQIETENPKNLSWWW
ncbi:MAG: DNA/RNA non-specific endonuclease [Bacteroidales bacterium]|nr:DNA/RNA non-specific endonuclease [Bacteroidales bacterium]